MELLWYIIAALGAGIGTGLAGLSAATVMVPILIVLCPSFSGETGAYQATAIALASDILGSAVTTYTYAKHKNIDLKRGGIMLVCILSMCTVGSYAAFLAGNVVLGSITLFLTFCIGIRFLVKPDTSREDQAAKGQKLDLKGVAISLFFGLTIGFGTGFVGTGGGMMMLVVFTVFLGMELKTAVGTSTFIMTFTALIASVSHILIHPAIILEKWDVMLLCIAVLVYPLLSLFENESWYGKLFVQKSPGEVKRSLLMVFFMFAAVIAVSWGVFHDPNAAAAAILMWGVGDAAAALVGIPFGKHKVNFRPVNGKKSWEGSLAMFTAAALVGIVILCLCSGSFAGITILRVLLMALAGTAAELLSPSEWDTVTVPVTMLAVALVLL